MNPSTRAAVVRHTRTVSLPPFICMEDFFYKYSEHCMMVMYSLQLAELNNPTPQAPSSGFGSTTVAGFGSSTSSFGSKGEH